MILEIEQAEKGFYDAKLLIRRRGNTIGAVQVFGRTGSMEANGLIVTPDFRLSLEPVLHGTGGRAIRPYMLRGDILDGMIYGMEHKTGFFSSYTCTHVKIKDTAWDMYPIGFGAQGFKNPVYIGKVQIAQIEKEAAVTDDLHRFRAYIKDAQSAAGVVALICISAYILSRGKRRWLGYRKVL